MTFIKKNSKLWFLIGATSLILSSWLLATIVDYAKSPSLYGLKSFSNETVKKVEAEFLFTLPDEGSIEFVTFVYTKIMHSGTGRISRMIMRPMSLYESNESSGKISLKNLIES